MRSTSLLLEDHKHILEALDVLTEMAARAERSQSVSQKDLEQLLSFLKGFGDRHHQGKEESVLFPALLKDHAQKNYHILCSFIFGHNRERSLVEGLSESMATKHEKDFCYYARRLNDLLRAHIREEEEVLFPLVDSALSPDEDESVLLDMKTYDEVWRKSKLFDQLRELADLKSKYLSSTSSEPAHHHVANSLRGT